MKKTVHYVWHYTSIHAIGNNNYDPAQRHRSNFNDVKHHHYQ